MLPAVSFRKAATAGGILRRAILPSVLLCAGCNAVDVPVSSRLAAISGGNLDDGDPAVVALFQPASLSPMCTGTLVAPHVVLTAAHCLAVYDVRVGLGAEPTPSMTVPAAHVQQHPDFDRATGKNDLGVVILAAPFAEVVPLQLEPLTEDLIGTAVRVVGFGRDPSDENAFGLKQEGVALIESLDDQAMVVVSGPSQPCEGDSGGPGFISSDGQERLAGVISRGLPGGDADCASGAVLVRVDPHVEGFIGAMIRASDPGGAGQGERCFYDDNCAAGLCVEALDDPTYLYCSTVCTTDEDCASPLRCVADHCRHATPTPGAMGAPCEADSDCGRSFCIAPSPGEQTVCSDPCSMISDSCLSGFSCQPMGAEDGAAACFAEQLRGEGGEGTGCAVGLRPIEPASPLLVVGVILAGIRRRRKRTLVRLE